MSNNVFIAPLGTEPQIITTAIDLLADNVPPIKFTKISILHSSSTEKSLIKSILQLNNEIPFLQNKFPNTHIEIKPHSSNENKTYNLDTTQEIDTLFYSIYNEVYLNKKKGREIHLLCSGGRKVAAIHCMLAAQLLFTDSDKLWYLISTGNYLKSKKMHPEEANDFDETKLLSIPFLSWRDISPILTDIEAIKDPIDTLTRVKTSKLLQKFNEARIFIEEICTPAERKVVKILALQGFNNAEISKNFNVSKKTIESQLRSVFMKAAAHWGLQAVNRTQLVAFTQVYFFHNKN